MLYRPPLGAAQLPVFTAWAAVAVCRTVAQLCGAQPDIKWTNDVLLHGRKLCGILTESCIGPDGPAFMVVGAGINLNRQRADRDVVFHQGSGRSLTCFGRVMMHGLPLPE